LVDERPTDKTGVLVIRVWVDGGPPPKLRARIIQTLDVTQQPEASIAVATRNEIELVVRQWIASFEASIQSGA
jgi:hypothetical protein